MQCPELFSLSLNFFLNRAAQFINKLVMLPLHVKNKIDIQTVLPLFRQKAGYKNGIGFPV